MTRKIVLAKWRLILINGQVDMAGGLAGENRPFRSPSAKSLGPRSRPRKTLIAVAESVTVNILSVSGLTKTYSPPDWNTRGPPGGTSSADASNLMEAHQPRHPVSTDPGESLRPKIPVNARAPIIAIRFAVTCPNLSQHRLILLRSSAQRVPTPGIQPTARDCHHPA